jgi:glutamyl-tRNA synthetase
MGVEEIIERFDLPHINRSNARFDVEKMHWVNYEHLRNLPMPRYRELAAQAGVPLDGYDNEYVDAALATCQEKVKQISELPAFSAFYFSDEFPLDAAFAEKAVTPESLELLGKLRVAYATLDDFSAENLEAALKKIAEDLEVKVRVLVQPARFACTGQKVGPSLYHLMEVLGREKVLARLDRALDRA